MFSTFSVEIHLDEILDDLFVVRFEFIHSSETIEDEYQRRIHEKKCDKDNCLINGRDI